MPCGSYYHMTATIRLSFGFKCALCVGRWYCSSARGTMMSSANYLSRLAADLCFDPFLRDYIQRVHACGQVGSPVSNLPILPENMPGYRAKKHTAEDAPAASLDQAAVRLITAIYVDNTAEWSTSLAHVPVAYLVNLNPQSIWIECMSPSHCTTQIWSWRRAPSLSFIGRCTPSIVATLSSTSQVKAIPFQAVVLAMQMRLLKDKLSLRSSLHANISCPGFVSCMILFAAVATAPS